MRGERAGHGVEAGGEDEHVDLVLARSVVLHAVGGDRARWASSRTSTRLTLGRLKVS